MPEFKSPPPPPNRVDANDLCWVPLLNCISKDANHVYIYIYMETFQNLNRFLTKLAFQSNIRNELFDEIDLWWSGRGRPLGQIQHMYQHTPQTASFMPCPILAGNSLTPYNKFIKAWSLSTFFGIIIFSLPGPNPLKKCPWSHGPLNVRPAVHSVWPRWWALPGRDWLQSSAEGIGRQYFSIMICNNSGYSTKNVNNIYTRTVFWFEIPTPGRA